LKIPRVCKYIYIHIYTYTYIHIYIYKDLIDKLIEIGGCYIIEMNVEKEINENFKTTIPSKHYDRPKTTREIGIF